MKLNFMFSVRVKKQTWKQYKRQISCCILEFTLQKRFNFEKVILLKKLCEYVSLTGNNNFSLFI